MHDINVLIIEDHPLMVDGYKSMLVSSDISFQKIVNVNTSEAAYNLLQNTSESFDLVFLDWNLPAFELQKIHNGGDLVCHINMHSPNSKIIIFTSHVEAILLYQIKKEIRPHALICKVDFTSDDFSVVYRKILNGECFYSSTVTEQVKRITLREKYLDNYNRQIILLLSKGIKTKNLPQYLPLSISTIDKRKAYIKDYFLLGKGNDEEIIKAAKDAGLI